MTRTLPAITAVLCLGWLSWQPAASVEEPKWSPSVEVFKDVPHVSRSAEQLALMAVGHKSLADLIGQVGKKYPGTVFSITPVVKNHRPVWWRWKNGDSCYVARERAGRQRVALLHGERPAQHVYRRWPCSSCLSVG